MLRTKVGFVASLAILAVCCGCEDTRAPLQTLNTNRTGGGPEPEGPPPTAADREEALKRIDKAIAAHGGATQLVKLRAFVQYVKGTLRNTPAEQELKIQQPDSVRLTVKQMSPMGAETYTLGMFQKKGWYAFPSAAKDMTDEQVADVLGELYFRRVQILVPLRDDEFVLRPITGVEVAGKPTVGIKVSNKNWPAVNLYFEAESSLLVKVTGSFREAQTTSFRELIFSEFKTVEGLRLPTRFFEVRGSAPFQDAVVEYSFPATLDKKDFERP